MINFIALTQRFSGSSAFSAKLSRRPIADQANWTLEFFVRLNGTGAHE